MWGFFLAVNDLNIWEYKWIWIAKMSVKINCRIITKNHAADSKIGSSPKVDFRADGTHESHPIAWELKFIKYHYIL